MSTNCVNCVVNERTGPDLLCDECRLVKKWKPKIGERCEYNAIANSWRPAEVLTVKEKADDSRIYEILWQPKKQGPGIKRWVCIQQLRPLEVKDYTAILHRSYTPVKWNSLKDTALPVDRRIMVSDGEVVVVGQVDAQIENCFQPEGVGGYEMELDFRIVDLTHWADAPALP